jgi:hypothetical protein
MISRSYLLLARGHQEISHIDQESAASSTSSYLISSFSSFGLIERMKANLSLGQLVLPDSHFVPHHRRAQCIHDRQEGRREQYISALFHPQNKKTRFQNLFKMSFHLSKQEALLQKGN